MADDWNWVTFCKRTNDPKLAYLQKQLNIVGIPNRRNGESFHAPILEIPLMYEDQANFILGAIDELDDDDPMFSQFGVIIW